ncbi:MAG: adenylyltransferase/cytidyltransferase family protein [Kiritimatiellia bacterium]
MSTAGTKILSIPDALALRDVLRQEGRCVVWTNGCYDLFHAGHVASIEFAKAQGDVLFVGVSSDESVRRNKGDLRPVVDERNRATVIAALEAVDVVVIFPDKDVTGLVQQFQPDVLVKGADRAGQVLGQEFVESHGGRVALCPVVPGLSTTALIEKVVKAYGPGVP